AERERAGTLAVAGPASCRPRSAPGSDRRGVGLRCRLILCAGPLGSGALCAAETSRLRGSWRSEIHGSTAGTAHAVYDRHASNAGEIKTGYFRQLSFTDC